MAASARAMSGACKRTQASAISRPKAINITTARNRFADHNTSIAVDNSASTKMESTSQSIISCLLNRGMLRAHMNGAGNQVRRRCAGSQSCGPDQYHFYATRQRRRQWQKRQYNKAQPEVVHLGQGMDTGQG